MVALAAFVGALAFLIHFESRVVGDLGYWTDELFSLWASDPDLTAHQAIVGRVLPDTAPPLYISMLWFVRQVIPEGRTAFAVLNGLGAILLLGLTFFFAARARAPALGLWLIAASLVSALGFCYALEGRNYVWVFCASLALGTLAGAVTTGTKARTLDLVAGGILAALATWLHLFGAFFAGGLAAALVLTGWLVLKRADVVRLGFAVGLSAIAAMAIWLAFAYRMIATTTTDGFWIVLDRAEIVGIFWIIKQYSVGYTPALAAGAAFMGLALLDRRLRALPALIGLALTTFAVLPFLISLHTPIVQGRYFLVGYPAILALMGFLLRDALVIVRNDRRPSVALGVAIAGVLFLIAPILTGASTAAWHFSGRWDWRGAAVVERAILTCRAGEVRALNSSMPENPLSPFGFGFDEYLKGRLRHPQADVAPLRDVADIDCPVYGWAEHYHPGGDREWSRQASQAQVLEAFRLTNRTNRALTVDRHNGGLVLRRADWTP